MKTLLAILLFGFTGNIFAIDACMTGAWYSPEREGEGINLEVGAEKLSGFFYTYYAENPHWFVFEGEDNFMLNLYTGHKISENPFKSLVTKVGTAKVLPVTDNILVFAYELELNYEGKPCINPESRACYGEFVYTRITDPVIPCVAPK